MVDEKNFQSRVQKIAELVQALDNIPEPASRISAKELVQLLMDLHGAGLERILEIVFQSGDSGAALIDELGQDPLVGGLLVLYGLHPQDLQARVERKLQQIASKLFKMGAEAKLLSIQGNDLRIAVNMNRLTCGSTTTTVRSVIEDAIYESAPDVGSLTLAGLEDQPAAGFVALEKLLEPRSPVTPGYPSL